MKEVILALMLGFAFCYEVVIFIKARSYVRTFIKEVKMKEMRMIKLYS